MTGSKKGRPTFVGPFLVLFRANEYFLFQGLVLAPILRFFSPKVSCVLHYVAFASDSPLFFPRGDYVPFVILDFLLSPQPPSKERISAAISL